MAKNMVTLNYGENLTTKNREDKIVNKKESSFIIVYLREYMPWKGDENYPKEVQETKTPAVLMLERWDGRQGFIGGEVDKGESIKEAAIREAKEEIGLIVDEKKVKPLISHSFAITTHSHSYEVSDMKEMKEIQSKVSQSKDYMNEIVGSSIVYIGDLGRGKGLTQVLKKNMATSCIEELVHLIIKEKLVDIEVLKKAVVDAGLNFAEVAEKPKSKLEIEQGFGM